MGKFPILRQHDAMDCGPTCLAMICAYYGKNFDIKYLHELCYISNEGVSLYGISIAAEKVGFRTIGAQITIDELVSEMPLPCVLHWNQNHFVVLYKIRKSKNGNRYYISNPAGGIRLDFNDREFIKCWLNGSNLQGDNIGAALSLQPTSAFYESAEEITPKKQRRTLNFLLSYLTPYRRAIYAVVLAVALGTGMQFILPFLTQRIVDVGIRGKDINIILLILLGQLVLECGYAITGFIRSWFLLKIGMRVNISLISDYLAKLMKLSISFFDTKLTGDIMQRINDHSRIQNFLTNASLDTLFSVVSIVVFGVIILIYNWLIAVVFFVGSILYIVWVWKFMKRRELLDHKMFALNSTNQSNIIQLITGMQEIKLNACEQQKRWEWEYTQRGIYRLSIKSLKLSQYQQSGGMFINQLKNLVITAIVAVFVVNGKLTFGMMLSIQYIVGMLNSPVDQLISFMRQYQDAKLSLARLQDIYTEQNEDDGTKNPIVNISNGDIVIHNLQYRYDKLSKDPILRNINLRVPKDKTTAIVGLSGSGKTTLLKMILGFYPPDNGYITINDVDLGTINKREWRKKCGIVMQEGYIFSDTIAKNIAPSTDNYDKRLIVKAAQMANITDFIDDLPLGYKTKIGNEGHGLSLGQKQRILIARAIFKNPEYIFLDEATNSLDANNEHQIMNNLNHFIKGRTAIIIAHRLSTVKNADNIIVLANGSMEEEGTHEELIAKRGTYYRLVKDQLDV